MTLSEQPFDTSPPAGPFGFDYRSSAHAVMFYQDQDFLLRVLCEFVEGALKAENGAVVLATASHQRGLEARLSARGIDVAALKTKGSYVALDADEVLAQCVPGGTPDLSRLNRMIAPTITGVKNALSRPGARVMVFGELVALLWARRQLHAVLVVEDFWERLATRLPFSLLCGYPIAGFDEPGTEESFSRICATHSFLIPPDCYSTPQTERRLVEAATKRHSG